VTETPDDTSYCLTMFDTLGGPEQNIEITRDEFILRPLSRKTRIPCKRGERGLGMLFGDVTTVGDVAERLKPALPAFRASGPQPSEGGRR